MDSADMIEWTDEDLYHMATKKPLKCRGCNKTSLKWLNVSGEWVMMEKNDTPHMCHKYSPSVKALKELANEVQSEIRKVEKWKLFDMAQKRGSIHKICNTISDNQLIDLYACFVTDKERRSANEPRMLKFNDYDKELAVIKTELLKRMAK